ncbi:S-layer homology domain-containing protein [Domibacillus mangrovi]|uniref:SLH domain-containing protein n=1 Tax=Domibacillus mangrovi TaxID=1714354 RepID=A0A1Q5P628_9BACI|nr:S-layer homology domain-containing protein [Domibacillus mangrovi]OKL37653.1 hypothetical protein BLL40_04965 [Domibacillus mangrovi]
MKKYPFSNKAAKAMIAATIAFTPVATTAGLFEANKVEAAYVQNTSHFASVKSFETYAKAIKDQAQQDSDVALALSSLDWELALADAFEQGATSKQKEAVAELLGLQASIYAGTYKTDDLQKFITAYKDELGTNLTDTNILAYLQKVEAAVYNEITTASFTGNYTYTLFSALANAVRTVDEAGIKANVSSVLVLTDAKLQTVVSNIEGHLAANPYNVSRTQLKNAMIKAGMAWYQLYGHETGGGGGGTPPPITPPPVVTPPPTPKDPVVVAPEIKENDTTVTATIPAALQTQIVANVTAETPKVEITIPARTDDKAVAIDIPGSLAAAIKGAAPKADIVINAGGTRYALPLSQVNLAALAAGLGGDLSQVSLRVTIDQLTSTESADLLVKIQAIKNPPTAASSQTKAAAVAPGIALVAPVVGINVELVSGNNVIEMKTFGDMYVEREFVLNKTVDTNRTTGVVVAADGSFKALPTTFKTEGSQQIAVVSSLTNDGMITVIESSVTFPDVHGGKNWAEKYIETLASKYIISGTTAGTYKPNDYMTRAQFALLLSRSLGLPSVEYDNRFKDVKGDEWFNVDGALMAAVQSGIVAGKADGTFAPNDRITRAEAAAMIGRALNLNSIKFDSSKLDTTKKLADFKDAKTIGASTREDVLKVYQAGIMAGASNGTFQPNEFTKRDQMARILAEFLIKADLMENIK